MHNQRRAHPDLNQGPADLQSAALTTELCTHEVQNPHLGTANAERTHPTACTLWTPFSLCSSFPFSFSLSLSLSLCVSISCAWPTTPCTHLAQPGLSQGQCASAGQAPTCPGRRHNREVGYLLLPQNNRILPNACAKTMFRDRELNPGLLRDRQKY